MALHVADATELTKLPWSENAISYQTFKRWLGRCRATNVSEKMKIGARPSPGKATQKLVYNLVPEHIPNAVYCPGLAPSD